MFGIVVLHITSLSTNEIGRYLTPKEILQKGSRPHVGRYCCPARGTVTTFSVRVCISYSDSDVIYTHIHTRSIEGLRGFVKGLRPFELRSLLSILCFDICFCLNLNVNSRHNYATQPRPPTVVAASYADFSS